ncbi:tRNA glutamyl-Q(34) synthetase GluQRS, partial [Escherichia coli]
VGQPRQSAVKTWRLTAVPESAIVNSTFSNASC